MANTGISKAKVKAKADEDAAIMGTNDSSIVSKRSVERLYSKTTHITRENEFLRHFVKKPRRRSPIINRGYWVRMKAVRTVISCFLERNIARKKVVINLGCGYDPLAFEFISENGSRDVVFVDVDYPELLQKKRKVLLETPELNSLLSNVESCESENVFLKSKDYLAIGVDLHDLSTFQKVLENEGLLNDADLIFVSEVATTYMEKEAADSIIKWAATLNCSPNFCLLEQILPEGPQHPFARTMLGHFNSLNTPIKSVHSYQTVDSQRKRFENRGWTYVEICDLVSFWSNEQFVPLEEKQRVDESEEFDEEEEFRLFCSHYFILFASKEAPNLTFNNHHSEEQSVKMESESWSGTFKKSPLLRRRFAATTSIKSDILSHGGVENERLDSAVVLSTESEITSIQGNTPSARLCHSLTTLNDGSVLLVGGRLSPSQSLKDCWHFKDNRWTRVQDLPIGRYRHCAAALNGDKVVLFGGKANDELRSEWLIWSCETGWTVLDAKDSPEARWGASMCSDGTEGYLSGGVNVNYDTLGDMWKWKLDDQSISFEKLNVPPLTRFGAQMHISGHFIVLLGGIGNGIIPRNETIIQINLKDHSIYPISVNFDPEPLLVGFSSAILDDQIIIIGGGAICFSFGSFWNGGVWTLTKGEPVEKYWKIHEQTKAVTAEAEAATPKLLLRAAVKDVRDAKISEIPIVSLTEVNFEDIMAQGKAVIIKNLTYGKCIDWNGDYLKEKAVDRKVTVHETSADNMNFQNKNFSYTSLSMKEFLDAVFSDSRRLYFRSLSTSAPTSKPASISTDFPEFSKDFQIPSELQYVCDNEFSSPLRISSSGVGLWLHYDVMSNCLFHCHGRKKMIVFPPEDINLLNIPFGQTTSRIQDVFSQIPKGSHPQVAEMNLGDVLYLPKLWCHAAMPLTPCVAINTFFKDLNDSRYAFGRDIYGNRDLRPYEKGRDVLSKLVKEFDGLEIDTKKFYLSRLAAELAEAADN